MKLRLLLAAAAFALAACGGGAGGSPVVAPTQKPAPMALSVHFVGGVIGGSILKDAIRYSRSATANNVELASPDATPDPNGSFSLSTTASTGATDGFVQVVASPGPAPSPSITTDSTTANIVPTPAPSPSATPFTTIPTVSVYEHTPNVSESKKITITSGGVTIQTNLWSYRTATVTCNSGPTQIVAAENQSALTFDATGNATASSDPTTADVYLTGQSCQGAFHDTGPYTLHVPGGAKEYAGTQTFDTLNSNDWSNVTAAINLYDFVNGYGVFQFKTRSGVTVKALPGSANYTNPAGFGFEFALSGKSPDGY